MNHKRKKPKFQRAGCFCNGKEGKNMGQLRRRDLRKIDPSLIGPHGTIRKLTERRSTSPWMVYRGQDFDSFFQELRGENEVLHFSQLE